MKKKIVTRLYKMGDPILMLKAKHLASAMNRDVFEFAEFNVEASDISQFELEVDDFQNIDADEELQGIKAEATELKDVKAEVVKSITRKIMTRVQEVHPVDTARYRRFGTKGMSEFVDAYLLSKSKAVAKKATLLLPEYTSVGLTAAMIGTLTTANNEFEDALEAQDIATDNRDIATEDRIEQGNALYAKVVRYTNFGKQIWIETDEAKYNDYVIYDTPNGEAPPDEPVV